MDKKTTVDDIIGIVHTDETTNSVEEVKKLRGRENKTEKRFTKCDDGTYCLMDNGNGLEYDDVVDLLNDLSEENEQLRKDATTLIYANQDYRKENEQLKSELEYYKALVHTQ